MDEGSPRGPPAPSFQTPRAYFSSTPPSAKPQVAPPIFSSPPRQPSSSGLLPPQPSITEHLVASQAHSHPLQENEQEVPLQAAGGRWATAIAPSYKRMSHHEVTPTLDGLRRLARQGSWRGVVEKVKESSHMGSLFQPPGERLAFQTYHILALAKLRQFGEALEELQRLGDLDSATLRYEAHPDQYPGKIGSLVPFTLRWLHAVLPQRVGQLAQTQDRLYNLLLHCNAKLDALVPPEAGSTALLAGGALSRSPAKKSEAPITPPLGEEPRTPLLARQDSAEFGDFASVTPADKARTGSHGETAAARHAEGGGSLASQPSEAGPGAGGAEMGAPADSQLPGSTGKTPPASPAQPQTPPLLGEDEDTVGVQPGLGGALAARWVARQEAVVFALLSVHTAARDDLAALQWLHALLQRRPGSARLLSHAAYLLLQIGDLDGARVLFGRAELLLAERGDSVLAASNRGLLYFALKDYGAAAEEWGAVLAAQPWSAAATNNRALCLMYSRDLMGAIKGLEETLHAHPQRTLSETLVLNLASMYELASTNSTESKRSLSNWISRVAPDDFDLLCTRLF